MNDRKTVLAICVVVVVAFLVGGAIGAVITRNIYKARLLVSDGSLERANERIEELEGRMGAIAEAIDGVAAGIGDAATESAGIAAESGAIAGEIGSVSDTIDGIISRGAESIKRLEAVVAGLERITEIVSDYESSRPERED